MNKLVDKWKAAGLLEGIEDELRREFVANNLENTAKWLFKVSNYPNPRTNSELFSGILLSCVGRISRKMVFRIDIVDAIESSLPVFNSIVELLPKYNQVESRQIDDRLTNIMEDVLYFAIRKEEQNYDKVQDSKG